MRPQPYVDPPFPSPLRLPRHSRRCLRVCLSWVVFVWGFPLRGSGRLEGIACPHLLLSPRQAACGPCSPPGLPPPSLSLDDLVSLPSPPLPARAARRHASDASSACQPLRGAFANRFFLIVLHLSVQALTTSGDNSHEHCDTQARMHSRALSKSGGERRRMCGEEEVPTRRLSRGRSSSARSIPRSLALPYSALSASSAFAAAARFEPPRTPRP